MSKTLESQLFIWGTYLEDGDNLVFRDCILKHDIKNFKKGTKVEGCVLDLNNSKLFIKNQQKITECDLVLRAK